MKKVCLALALMLSASLALAGCGGEEAPPTLTLMGKKSDLAKPYMTAIFDKYEAETGNKLKIISVEDEYYEIQAENKFRSTDPEEELPDVFLHFHNADLNRYDVEKNFVYLEGETWVSELTDSSKAYCTDDQGHLLGLPFWESSVSGCYYNTKLFEQYNLKPATTQAEFDALCAEIKTKSKTPILWPADNCSWMAQFGLDPVFADGEEGAELLSKLNSAQIDFTDIPAVKNMVTWIDKANKAGWFGDNCTSKGWDDISTTMSRGDALMTFIWDTWFYTDYVDGVYTKEDFALMPVFLNTTDAGTYEGGNLNMMMVNKRSENKQLALDFLAFCAKPENYNAAFKDIPTVSVFKGQTTNITSKMVQDAQASVTALERVSTANTKILGYSADDMAFILRDLLNGKASVDECVFIMDADRRQNARALGIAGF